MKTAYRSLLASGRKFVGTYLQQPSALMIEVMHAAGMDYITFDMEHGTFDYRDLLEMTLACDACGMASSVRVPSLDGPTIGRVLDLGISCIKIPGISSAEDAAAAVSYCRYPPEGNRGICMQTRNNHFGFEGNYSAKANEELVVHLLVEGVEGVKNLESIVAVPGVDCVTIGTGDLCFALGVPGQPRHPSVLDAVAECAAICEKYGKSCSVKGKNLDDVRRYASCKGVSHFSIDHPEKILYAGYKQHIDKMREILDT